MIDTRPAKQRLDKWLFFARVVKSRSLAASLSGGGKVRVNRDKVDKPAFGIKIGDTLTITLERKLLVYKVKALAERRGPASEAQTLYEDLTPPVAEAVQHASVCAGGRPTKRDRRQLQRLRDQEM